MTGAPLGWDQLREVARRRAERVLGDHQAAADIAQTVIAALFVLDGAGRRPTNPEAWIAVATANLAKNEFRRRSRQSEAFERLVARPADDCAEDFADRVVGRLVVDELLAQLSEKQREALRLTYGEI